MPLNVNPPEIIEESNRPLTSGYIELFEIDLTKFSTPDETLGIIRFTTAYSGGEGVVVRFAGEDYQPMPVKAEGFEWTGDSTAPRPKLSMSAINNITAGMIVSHKNLVGATVKRIRTFAKFLDDGIVPNPLARFQEDIYKIDRMTKLSQFGVELELVSIVDQQGQFLPRNKIIKRYCTYVYRKYNGQEFVYDPFYPCPYTRTAANKLIDPVITPAYYDNKDNPVIDPSLDSCSKRTSGCKARYGIETLPFNGFPGVLNDY